MVVGGGGTLPALALRVTFAIAQGRGRVAERTPEYLGLILSAAFVGHLRASGGPRPSLNVVVTGRALGSSPRVGPGADPLSRHRVKSACVSGDEDFRAGPLQRGS